MKFVRIGKQYFNLDQIACVVLNDDPSAGGIVYLAGIQQTVVMPYDDTVLLVNALGASDLSTAQDVFDDLTSTLDESNATQRST